MAHGNFLFVPRASPRTAPSSRASRITTGSNHPLLTSSQYFPSRITINSCTVNTRSLRRLRFFKYSGGEVNRARRHFVFSVHKARMVVNVTYLLAKTLAVLGVQMLTTSGSFHPIGNVWILREEACSFSVPLVSGGTAGVEDVMPASQTCHVWKEEL